MCFVLNTLGTGTEKLLQTAEEFFVQQLIWMPCVHCECVLLIKLLNKTGHMH